MPSVTADSYVFELSSPLHESAAYLIKELIPDLIDRQAKLLYHTSDMVTSANVGQRIAALSELKRAVELQLNKKNKRVF